MQTRKKD